MGMTEGGYRRRTFDEIIKGKMARAKAVFGEDMDVSEASVLGKFLRINAYDQAYLEELAEEIYYARFPTTANGMNIDKLMPFGGITRNEAQAAVVRIALTGTPGFTVAKGFLVGNEGGLHYATTQDVELGEEGTAQVLAQCTTKGSMGNVNYTSISRIIHPEENVREAVGVEAVIPGVDMEGDYSARIRLVNAIQGAGSTNETSVRAGLLRIPTVQSAGVIVNDSDETDSKGRPPHSFECFVTGGEGYHQEIAEMIFNKKPLGIKTYGKESVIVKDSGGYDKEIRFSHSTSVKVICKMTLRKSTAFGVGGEQEIIAGLQQYIDGLGLAKDLIFSALFGYIYKVQGVLEVVDLSLSTDGGTTYHTNNILPEDWEIVRFERAEITYAEAL